MFLVASWNPSSCLLLLLDMSFRFCLCGMYLSLRDAFKVRECPGFLLTWEVWAIEPSGISEYKAAVPPAGAGPGFLEGWLTTAQSRAGVDSVQGDPGPVMGGQTAPGTDWSQRTSRGLGVSASICVLPLVRWAQILHSDLWDSPWGQPSQNGFIWHEAPRNRNPSLVFFPWLL